MRPAVRDYGLVGVFALLVLTVLLLVEGIGFLSLLPLAVGALGLVANLSVAPPLVLMLVTVGLTFRNRLMGLPDWYRPAPLLLSDLGMAVSLVVYVVAAFRLRALTRHAVPPRQRRKPAAPRAAGRWALRGTPTERSAREVGPEVLLLLLTASAAAGLGYALWGVVSLEERPPWADFPRPVWRGMLVVWAGALALVVVNGLQGYLKALFAGRDASLIYLQDELWTATRGEQRRIWRWLVWARLRRAKKEGGR